MPAGDYLAVVEDLDTRPEEWVELQHAGSGTPGFLKVEYELHSGKVRSSGPVVVHNPPHAPAP